jgi:hypothetical protein
MQEGKTMDLSLPATRARMSVPRRWLLFGAAVALGAVAGKTVNIEPLDWAYTGLLRLFGNPGAQIPGLAAGVGLGFVLGFIHLTSI